MKLNRDQIAEVVSATIAELYKQVQTIANVSGDETPHQQEMREAIERNLTALISETIAQDTHAPNPPQEAATDTAKPVLYDYDGQVMTADEFLKDATYVLINKIELYGELADMDLRKKYDDPTIWQQIPEGYKGDNELTEKGQQEYENLCEYYMDIIEGIGAEPTTGIKTRYRYSVSNNTIWTSFDYGEVEAVSPEMAKKLAIEKLRYAFLKANDALEFSDNTAGFSIRFNEDEVTVEPIS